MSLVEYYDQLAEIAIGWLGWTEDQALRADVNAISAGYAGKIDMFCTIGWLKKVEKPQAPALQLSPALFDAMLGKRP